MTQVASEADRLAAVERQLDQLTSRRDGWVAFSLVLSALAIFVAIVAVGFGFRAVDESKQNVAAPPGDSAGAAAGPCKDAAGFPDDARVEDKGTEPASGDTVEVEAGDSFFDATCTSGVTAGTVTVTVHNAGQQLHNFSVPDQGIDEDVAAGGTVTVEVEVGSSPVQYFCKFHRTSGMVGALLPATT